MQRDKDLSLQQSQHTQNLQVTLNTGEERNRGPRQLGRWGRRNEATAKESGVGVSLLTLKTMSVSKELRYKVQTWSFPPWPWHTWAPPAVPCPVQGVHLSFAAPLSQSFRFLQSENLEKWPLRCFSRNSIPVHSSENQETPPQGRGWVRLAASRRGGSGSALLHPRLRGTRCFKLMAGVFVFTLHPPGAREGRRPQPEVGQWLSKGR